MPARDFENCAGLARLESILARIYVKSAFASIRRNRTADRLDAKAVVESILETFTREARSVFLVLKRRVDPKVRRLMKLPTHVFGDSESRLALYSEACCARFESEENVTQLELAWVSEQRRKRTHRGRV